MSFEEKLNRMIATRDKQVLKLEEELEEKNRIIEELTKINEKSILAIGRDEIKEEIVNRVTGIYPEATVDFVSELLEEIKRDLIKVSTKKFLVINRN
ncbi:MULTISPECIES: hypothetical protein [Clostridium]|jgi:hypothetical protein|uniref:hypothetical protein n=2 Tax=Clostridiaceae TaxID=31979 RepID=UPI0032EC465A